MTWKKVLAVATVVILGWLLVGQVWKTHKAEKRAVELTAKLADAQAAAMSVQADKARAQEREIAELKAKLSRQDSRVPPQPAQPVTTNSSNYAAYGGTAIQIDRPGTVVIGTNVMVQAKVPDTAAAERAHSASSENKDKLAPATYPHVGEDEREEKILQLKDRIADLQRKIGEEEIYRRNFIKLLESDGTSADVRAIWRAQARRQGEKIESLRSSLNAATAELARL
jgi:hypothetical protein